jgi:hypothetical protein
MDTLNFIKECIRNRQIFWTYHINMRLSERSLKRSDLLRSVDSFEIIESYPDDKYFPSYLLYGRVDNEVFHLLVGVDVDGKNIRIITVYRPDQAKWDKALKRRATK